MSESRRIARQRLAIRDSVKMSASTIRRFGDSVIPRISGCQPDRAGPGRAQRRSYAAQATQATPSLSQANILSSSACFTGRFHFQPSESSRVQFFLCKRLGSNPSLKQKGYHSRFPLYCPCHQLTIRAIRNLFSTSRFGANCRVLAPRESRRREGRPGQAPWPTRGRTPARQSPGPGCRR